MPDVPDIAVKPLPGISPEQALDVRAKSWAFVFRCWQAKQMAAEPTPEPNGRNDGAIVRDTEWVSHVEQRPDRPSEIT
jgi:5-methylcytosine-specific restriction endonuclease McrBC GTP-binding regulatory subunit McrB